MIRKEKIRTRKDGIAEGAKKNGRNAKGKTSIDFSRPGMIESHSAIAAKQFLDR